MSASAIRVAAPLAALCFAASMAAAQTGVIDPDRVHPGLAHSAQPTKDLPGDKAHPALSQFSMQDRAEIYRAVAGAQQNRSRTGRPRARTSRSVRRFPIPFRCNRSRTC